MQGMPTRRIYLDNAATSFPKPPGVYEAMVDFGTRVGASPGRGQYAESREASGMLRVCRERLARLINAEDPSRIAFALNTTDALNLAIKGVLRAAAGRSRHVVTTAMDHNSVLRPLSALRADGVAVTHVDADDEGFLTPGAVRDALRDDTCLVAVNMASNVTGSIQPIRAIAEVCHGRGVALLVDGAQALGHVPVDVQAMGIDLLAFPGHKGLMGPQGTGGLYVHPAMDERLATSREGGTGHLSEVEVQPATMPEKLEAGSHNTIGIVGLAASVGWILEQGVGALRRHELALMQDLIDRLLNAGVRTRAEVTGTHGALGRLRLLGPTDAARRVGVFTFVHDEVSGAEIAAMLEQDHGVLARSGITCAPRAHRAMGTLERAGGVRLSLGPFVTREHIRVAFEALVGVCRQLDSLGADTPGTLGGSVRG